jgi:ABC-type sugar transport system permease subunit
LLAFYAANPALIFSTLFDDLFGPINALTGAKTDWLADTAPILNAVALAQPMVDQFAAWRLALLSETLAFVAGGLTTTKAFWVLVLLSVWVAFPFMMLIGTAALRTVPAEVYDAARVDGAGGCTSSRGSRCPRSGRRSRWRPSSPLSWRGRSSRSAEA